jgi:hypothetical protein
MEVQPSRTLLSSRSPLGGLAQRPWPICFQGFNGVALESRDGTIRPAEAEKTTDKRLAKVEHAVGYSAPFDILAGEVRTNAMVAQAVPR